MTTAVFHLPGLIISLALLNCSQEKKIDQAGFPENTDSTDTFQNPVFNNDFPDPNLAKAPDGYFYAYSTQANYGEGLLVIPILRSKDLLNWEELGAALDKKPDWKAEGGIWAPDAVYHNGEYRLYYSYSTWGDTDPGIGVAVSDKPEGPFRDLGKLFFSQEIGVDNSIDAFFIEDNGTPYLFWGSFHGIYGIELSADGRAVTGKKFRIAGDAYEGSYILKKNEYYYYFGSTGTCCEGANSTYKVKVGRATSLKGPYLDKEGRPLLENGGTLILESNTSETGFVGPGHNGDIVTDDEGQDWMIYHAYSKNAPDKGRLMLLDKIEWTNGWPVIKDRQPGLEEQAGPVFR